MLPRLDAGLSALITDLDQRGMLADTAVVMWGEFGRTPRINSGAGRDHWARASAAFVAGGGMKTGQVIGSTNRYAETPKDRPVHLHEMFATFYHLLGIDPKTTTLTDPNGRPQYLVNVTEPIKELVG
jgi:arylsulfatase A-like enzyme